MLNLVTDQLLIHLHGTTILMLDINILEGYIILQDQLLLPLKDKVQNLIDGGKINVPQKLKVSLKILWLIMINLVHQIDSFVVSSVMLHYLCLRRCFVDLFMGSINYQNQVLCRFLYAI